ncbi:MULTISPECIES: MSHA biogenesis protein MshK [Corallincola]|uniref:MSHA biogenesis protein MshK n=3 Tax=Corallincola TaxID=1775176 RepID=A0A368NIX4_9GAMM|nr:MULTISPECIES: MSHA biogenesis protein MshK [Corallincola]RCU49823.1 MSHA biogenesis protein MshK [Corallincola holothuriorum]TAA45201.1 MSHA biogenesis protein MshK [Corallincola spongiicola]TCI03522.1 MSHA biogenesis protein MshK [Corallincola luteus]
MKRLFFSLLICASSLAMAATELKDPTRPPGQQRAAVGGGQQAAKPSSLQLQQILFQDEQSLVIINGQQLRTGQKIRGYTVGKISANQVELIRGDKRVKLTLFTTVKQASK